MLGTISVAYKVNKYIKGAFRTLSNKYDVATFYKNCEGLKVIFAKILTIDVLMEFKV